MHAMNLLCVYIKRHSPSTRDNAADAAVSLTRIHISLASSHVTFDYRLVNAFNEQRAISNNTSRPLFVRFFLSRDYSFPMQYPMYASLTASRGSGKREASFSDVFIRDY